MTTRHTHADGLVQRYGPYTGDNKVAGEVRTDGVERQLVLEFSYDDLPAPRASDTSQGYIPAGALVTSAYLFVDTAFADGTALAIGTEQLDGTDIDIDGFLDTTNGATANLGAGVVLILAGVDVGTVVSATLDAYPKVTATGTFTAGSARLVINYIPGYDV